MLDFTLNPLVIPDGHTLKRRHIVPDKYRLDGYDETYDFRTLAYDAIWMPKQKSILLVCPKLLNLEDVLKSARITASGQVPGRPRIRRYRRHDEVWIGCASEPAEITIETPELTLHTKLSRQESAYNGKNVIVTKSKDNALAWLTDWTKHHARHQDANAVLVFDNGSSDYSLGDLAQAIGPDAGMTTSAAVASDFPFGSWKATKLLHRSMFYQAGILNLARHRFLHDARAVLPIDVDEMITGANVFDAAANSRLGYVTIPGVWRYSQLPDDQMPLHSDHIWRREPDAWSKEKYCLAPNRWFTRSVWDIHGLLRYAFNKRVLLDDARMLHCEHISTGWKRKRDGEKGMQLVKDPQAQKDLGAA